MGGGWVAIGAMGLAGFGGASPQWLGYWALVAVGAMILGAVWVR